MPRLSKMIPPLALAGMLGLALPGLTSAQIEPPHLKPGQWDMAMDVSGMAITMQMCMDESVESRAKAFQPPAAGGARNCSQQDVKQIPGGFSVNATCTAGGHTTHTEMTMIGDFQSSYKMDMLMRPDTGPERKMSMAAHWSGPCPAGMKPGQVVTKMDMSNLAAIAAAAQARRNGEGN